MPKLGLGLSLPQTRAAGRFSLNFWTNLSFTAGKVITGFSSTFTNALTVNWGDGTTTPLTSGLGVNKTLGTTNAIGLEPNNSVVTRINCGTSSPKLSGTIDLSAFPNLTGFTCNDNNITTIGGYENNANLISISFIVNQVTGSIPSLSALTNLVLFSCHSNQLTGSIPSLSGLNALQDFRCYLNNLTGSIPSLVGLTQLRYFYCSDQLGATKLTGSIPSLSTNTVLIIFSCKSNQLTGFAGGSVSNTLGDFQAQNNQLTSAAVNAILAAFVTANKITGTRILNLGGAGNGAPTGQGITDKATLISRGWTVTTN